MKKHFRVCKEHSWDAEMDPEVQGLPQVLLGPNPFTNTVEPLKCRVNNCDNPVFKTYGVKCYHNRAQVFYHVETKSIKRACWVCRQYFDVPLDEAKALYIEHRECGGLLARWLDVDTFRLKGGCTKCDYTEDKGI